MLWVFGITAGALQAVAYLPYIRDILAGSTRPHRGTWAIWCTLSCIALVSQRANGASWSLVLTAAQAAGTVVVIALAFRRGVGGTSRVEIAMLAIALMGLVGWYVAGNPTVATVCVVVADAIAVGMMVPKTYVDPYSETLSSYWLALASGAFGLLAVGSLDVGLLIYPAYIMCADMILVAVMVTRRPQTAGA